MELDQNNFLIKKKIDFSKIVPHENKNQFVAKGFLRSTLTEFGKKAICRYMLQYVNVLNQ